MKKIKATKGDVALYEQLKDGELIALKGITSAGNGWRPACNGKYLGNQCFLTEGSAIDAGKIFLNNLKCKIETLKRKRPSKVSHELE